MVLAIPACIPICWRSETVWQSHLFCYQVQSRSSRRQRIQLNDFGLLSLVLVELQGKVSQFDLEEIKFPAGAKALLKMLYMHRSRVCFHFVRLWPRTLFYCQVHPQLFSRWDERVFHMSSSGLPVRGDQVPPTRCSEGSFGLRRVWAGAWTHPDSRIDASPQAMTPGVHSWVWTAYQLWVWGRRKLLLGLFWEGEMDGGRAANSSSSQSSDFLGLTSHPAVFDDIAHLI